MKDLSDSYRNLKRGKLPEATKWLSTLKETRDTPKFFAVDGPYSYRTDNQTVLASTTTPTDMCLPVTSVGALMIRARHGAISGHVNGLRHAVKSLAPFANVGDGNVYLALNGRLDMTATCHAGDAKTYLDGPDYSHVGHDVQLSCNCKALALALAGLPDDLTYHIDIGEKNTTLHLSAQLPDGEVREAILSAR